MVTDHVDAQVTALDAPGDRYIDCRIDGVAGERVDLRGSHFEGCTFTACSLRLATLTDVRLIDCTFVSCDLMGVDLTRARWGQFSLSEPLRVIACRLDYANLHGLALDGAAFYDCSLVEADLAEATLRRADLRFADLTSARLNGADLSGADLSGARGYAIHPEHTRVEGTVVSLPEAGGILEQLGMVITSAGPLQGPDDRVREARAS